MYIDLTKTIQDGMAVYANDPAMSLKKIADVDHEGYHNYELKTSMHVGTHIDGPFHMVKHQPLISEYPLDHFIGLGKKVKLFRDYHYDGEEILFIDTKTYLTKSWIDGVLIYPIRVIVLEIESPDDFPYDIHKMCFDKGVFIVENATNFELLPNNRIFKAFVIPLKIEADSSPCRLFVEI